MAATKKTRAEERRAELRAALLEHVKIEEILEAHDTIVKIMRGDIANRGAVVRHSAARDILDRYTGTAISTSVEDQLERLEKMMEERVANPFALPDQSAPA